MLKLLSIAILTSSFLFAQTTSSKINAFIKTKLAQVGKKIEVKSVDVIKVYPLKGYKNWSLYLVDVSLITKQGGKEKLEEVNYELFSDGLTVTLDLLNIKTGQSLKALAQPKFKSKYYHKSNLIYGNKDAKNKIVVFSDPLCPFCIELIPTLIRDAKNNPKKFALYLYDVPLKMHPASKALVKAMVAARFKGVKDVVLNAYTVDKGKKIKKRFNDKGVNPTFTVMTTEEKVTLDEFNEAVGTKLTIADINSKKVLNHIKREEDLRKIMLVTSTPTLYVNGKRDTNNIEYNKLKK